MCIFIIRGGKLHVKIALLSKSYQVEMGGLTLILPKLVQYH